MEYFCTMNAQKELELKPGVAPRFKLFRKINLNHDIVKHNPQLKKLDSSINRKIK